MGYCGLTAFLDVKNLDETPKQLAMRKTKEWREMPEAQMQTELTDLFQRVKILLDEVERLHAAEQK
jgi:hypothetical protein